MNKLAKKKCVPCEEGGDPLSHEEAEKLLKELDPAWMLTDDAHLLVREFRFKDFAEAIGFANKVAAIAEKDNHHPDLSISWGSVGVRLSTHSIGGLSENDFILASKIDTLPRTSDVLTFCI